MDRLPVREHAFCPADDCGVVFTAANGTVLTTAMMRQPPAYKTGTATDLLCYCFNLRGVDFLSGEGEVAVGFIRDRIRAGDCACDILNPSAGCCLGSIVRYRKLRS